MFIGSVAGFIEKYYVEPIVEGTGYNVVNTLTYIFILALVVFLVFKALDRLDIGLDRDLWINLIPFVFLGGVLRVLMDSGTFEFLGSFRYLFVSPIIFFLVFSLAFLPLLIVHYFDLNRNYLGFFGLFLLFLSSAGVLFQIVRPLFFLLILGVAILGCFLTYFLLAFGLNLDRFKNIVNWSPIFAHSLDASSTAIAIGVVGGYAEQHVVPALFFEHVSVFFFIPLKLAIAAAAVYYIDEVFSKKWSWILKFTIFVVGLGPGVRNALAVLMGV